MRQLRILNIIILLGFAAIIFGLYSLQQLISTERTDAFASISQQRKTLNEYALRIYEIAIDKGFMDMKRRIKRSLTNPLLGDNNIILVENGIQKLPRPYATITTPPDSEKLYQSILDSRLPQPLIKDSLWLKRLSLYRRAIVHIKDNDSNSIQKAIRNILKHRSLYKMDPRFDIPSVIALLQFFSDSGKPNQNFMNRVLLRGYGNADKILIKGLQPDLLSNRNKFLKVEFEFLSRKIIGLSQKHNVSITAFKRRAKQQPTLLSRLPLPGESYIYKGEWYLSADKTGKVTGFRIDIKVIRTLIQKHMLKVGLIFSGDQVMLSPLKYIGQTHNQPLSRSQKFIANVKTPRWSIQLQRVKKRYIFKTSLILLTGLVSLLLAVLSLLHQKRKQEYIALKADFIQAISHELRTPLTSIRLMAETLELRLANNPDAKDYPGRIVKDIDGLGFLVENILSFNRLEKGLWALEKGDINIEEIISSINSEIHLYTNKKVSISVVQNADCRLKADLHLFKMLLFNLIRNSCYYNRNSEIKIDITCHMNQKSYIEYKDNGIGIDEKKWKDVFKDFYRILDSKRGNVRGSGLGLAICRKIMKLHGGNIFIYHSNSQGSSFKLVFGNQ